MGRQALDNGVWGEDGALIVSGRSAKRYSGLQHASSIFNFENALRRAVSHLDRQFGGYLSLFNGLVQRAQDHPLDVQVKTLWGTQIEKVSWHLPLQRAAASVPP
jgi:hypothetical protein